jgi:ubiquinone/menaquinone biosynthesis C-methylase UbiE
MNKLKSAILHSVRPIHEKFRNEKIALFLDLVNGQARGGRVLDLGEGPGINGEFLPLYAKFEEVVVMNLQMQNLENAGRSHVRELVADARELPLESQSFDWVSPNAVIEHVGPMQEQRRFADEVRRIAHFGYVVACLNKVIPIEPHTLLPFYQFLPTSLQRKWPLIARLFKRIRRDQPAHREPASGAFPRGASAVHGIPGCWEQHCGYFKKDA